MWVMTNEPQRYTRVLSIAGSDSGGGAGIQADLKTFAALGCYGMTAITALTAQNTLGVSAIHGVPPEMLKAQLCAVFDDIGVDAVKIGMLHAPDIVRTVAWALKHYGVKQVVLDPVMVATSGAKLLADDALQALRERLLPLATVLTPNIPEAELLLGHPIPDDEAAEAALVELLALDCGAVLLKGGHLPGNDVMTDRFDDGEALLEFEHPRLDVEGHGTGCTLASAIAANLCLGLDLRAACADATDYVHGALRHAYRPGHTPVAVLQHFWRLRGDIAP